MVDSNDEVSDVYILTDASLSDTDSQKDVSQKMNVCYSDCDSEPSEFEEEERHYSDETDTEDFTEEESEHSSSETVTLTDTKNPSSSLNSLPPQPPVSSLCPYPKTVASSSSSLPVNNSALDEENAFLKKMVKSTNLLYFPVEVQVRGEWISVDAFIDTGGSIVLLFLKGVQGNTERQAFRLGETL